MQKVTVTKTNGNTGATEPSADGVSGYITNGVAVTGGVQLGVVYKLGSVADAEALLIDAAYDSTNSVLVYHAIKEYFRFSSSTLYIMVVAQTVTMTEMCNPANTQYAKKLLKDAGGAIKQWLPERQYLNTDTPVLTGGLDNDVLIVTVGSPTTRTGALINAQALCDQEEAEGRQTFCVMPCMGFNGTATNAPDLRACKSRNVYPWIGTDLALNGLGTLYEGHADGGGVLGMWSFAKVNESIGWPEKFNLLNEAEGKYLKPGLSSNTSINDYSAADLQILEDKGYSFPVVYPTYPGVFVNATPTAVDITDDYAWGQNIRTINKAISKVIEALTPKVNSPQTVNPTTGQLSVDTTKYFENLAKAALATMEVGGEIIDKGAYVNPAQNLLAASELAVEIDITPYGTTRKIKATIGFKNPFK